MGVPLKPPKTVRVNVGDNFYCSCSQNYYTGRLVCLNEHCDSPGLEPRKELL